VTEDDTFERLKRVPFEQVTFSQKVTPMQHRRYLEIDENQGWTNEEYVAEFRRRFIYVIPQPEWREWVKEYEARKH
jgi:hypothetical protein